MSVDLKFCSDSQQVAEQGAACLTSSLKLVADEQPGALLSLAVSGGRIAEPLFRALRGHLQGQSFLPRLHLFWVDERCVPPESSDSNYQAALQHLIVPLQLADQQVHRIRGELAPPEAATQANADLQSFFQFSSRQPGLDVVFLGMGEDGHTASLFPGQEAGNEGSPAYVAVHGPKPPPWRISLSYPMLWSAGHVVVLANGAAKATALRQSLKGGGTPLGKALAGRRLSTVITDIPPKEFPCD